ncbi:BamA/TamA family outer membrane protein [Synechocystis sp. PCC 7509]|uniref:BamA/TamA family outer membrane protein n=1 Tax=Synechocystis sp. PCC 7509 TaxID=927677 RepID=UPI0002AC1613|nr:BamA/TamA family outer membrane protein [Synechocystis sp. PCC 7509]
MCVFYLKLVVLAVIFNLNVYCVGATTLPEMLRQQRDSKAPESDLFILATDVQIIGAKAELTEIVRNVISTRQGSDTSNRQLQADIKAILATGLFVSAQANTTSNATGIDVVITVEPIIVTAIASPNANVLPANITLKLFQTQFGKEISLEAINQSRAEIDKWYTENGYVAAKVLAINPSPDGVLTIDVAEGIVSNVKFRFLNRDGDPTDSKGNLIKSRTTTEFLRREVRVKPGDVVKSRTIEQDLRQLYQLGLFRTVNVALVGAGEQVEVIYDLTEKPARSVSPGGGYDDDTGIYGTIEYQDFNLSGINNSIDVDLQFSRRDLQFATTFTSPYRASEPDLPGYEVTVFRRRGTSPTFDSDIDLANGSNPREGRYGGGFILNKPIDEWQTSLGLNYTRISIRDRDGNISPIDELGNQLSFSGKGIDDLTIVSVSAIKDDRNDRSNPTQGSIVSLSTEQSIPIGRGDITMNRLQANYIQYFPVQILGQRNIEVLAFNLQGGTIIGDLPPYEAFNLGGLDSVRAYGGSEVGSGRSYVLASAEYRFLIFQPVGGVLFADFATDLGSGDTVLGEPAVVRGKPGTGFSYGAGLRVESPIGLLRADFGINDRGESQVQFGIGQRF